MPHQFGGFTEKTIFEDLKDSPQRTKGGNKGNKSYNELLQFNNEIYVRQ